MARRDHAASRRSAASDQRDVRRNGSHSGSSRPSDRRKPSEGAFGARASRRPASWNDRFSFRELQRRHAATTLSHVCVPPRDFGIT